MLEKQSDGSLKSIWFRILEGKCWTGGIPSVGGKCVYCGHKIEDHQKIESKAIDPKLKCPFFRK